MTKALKRAVFIDRDGTLNVEKNYLWRIEDFEFIPGAPEAIRRLNRAGFLVVVVTNQAGVARGYFQLEDVDRLHRYIQGLLVASEARVDAFYVCPHHPDFTDPAVNCQCRKPAPGMLLQAARELGIDLNESYMIGDKVADVEAGQSAGCQPLLVRTGYGAATAESDPHLSVPVFPALSEAVDWLLEQSFCTVDSD